MTLYFGCDGDLYVATRRADGAFGTPVAVCGVNTSESEASPVITADQLTLYFARGTNGNYYIYVAHRVGVDDEFST